MKKILCINAHPVSDLDTSISNKLMNYSLDILKEKESNGDIHLNIVDLDKIDIPKIDRDMFIMWNKSNDPSSLNKRQREIYNRQREILKLWKEADRYIISYPIHNLNIPVDLKNLIDNVSIARETFKYTSNGPIGLLDNRKSIIIQASGNIYTETEEGKEIDYAIRYMDTSLKFMGIEENHLIRAEGTAISRIDNNDILDRCKKELSQILENF